jgi:hypothetical protein
MMFAFTAFFLTVNHLYLTFASPIASKDSVADGQSLNLTHALAKRDYTPTDQLCNEPDDWLHRNCLTTTSDRAWVDSCLHIDDDEDDDVEYWEQGECPPGTMCMNTYSPPPDSIPTIICMFRPTGFTDLPRTNGDRPPPAGQVGVTEVQNSYTPIAMERIVSVPIKHNIARASVSAFIEGMYQTSTDNFFY